MKTLADLKRRLQPGTVITLTYHKYAETWGAFGARPEKIAERDALLSGAGLPGVIKDRLSNQVTIARPTSVNVSWLTFPKKTELRIDGPDTFTILDDHGAAHMTYRLGAERQE